MPFSCAFDSGYDAGFEICSPVIDPDTRYQRGVPSATPRPRKRPDVAEIAGVGYVAVIGAGRLAGEACLSGSLEQPSEGIGQLVRETFRVLVGQIRSGAESILAVERSLSATAVVASAGYGVMAGELRASGSGAVAISAYSRITSEQFVSGRMPVRTGGEATLMAQENDEALILMAGMEIVRRLR